MKKILFINLAINCGWASGINHGIAVLVPIARKNFFEVSFLNLRHEISPKKFEKIIGEVSPTVIAFSSTSQQLKYLSKFSNILPRFPEMLSIVGGVGPTLDPITFLTQSQVNGVCIGEGEIALTDLLINLNEKNDIFSTKGFAWINKGQLINNSNPNFVRDLSKLDFPDYSIFDRKLILGGGRLNVMLSRGCPYNCNYCCNHSLKNKYSHLKNYFRLPSVEYGIELLSNLIQEYPETQRIDFEDDLLISNKEWFTQFANEYSKKIKLPYRLCVRTECIDEEIVSLLTKTGCEIVYLGLECGNEEFRKKILNRHYTNDQIIKKCKLMKNAELKIFTFNMVGFPYETESLMEETLELNKQIEPDEGTCSFFYPYKGTKLYQICKENNLLKEESELINITNYNSRPSIKMDDQLEKICMSYQKKISAYLNRKKLFHSWAESKLKNHLVLYDLIRNYYSKLGHIKNKFFSLG